MSILLANEFSAGRFSKILIARNVRKDGGLSLAEKWCGSIESYVVRSAARYFVGQPEAVEMSYTIGGKKYRVTKF